MNERTANRPLVYICSSYCRVPPPFTVVTTTTISSFLALLLLSLFFYRFLQTFSAINRSLEATARALRSHSPDYKNP